jgi:hypothetical protein
MEIIPANCHTLIVLSVFVHNVRSVGLLDSGS